MKNLILENNKIYFGGRNRKVVYKISSIGKLIIRINVPASYLKQNLTSLMNDGCVYINNNLFIFKSIGDTGNNLYIEYEEAS